MKLADCLNKDWLAFPNGKPSHTRTRMSAKVVLRRSLRRLCTGAGRMGMAVLINEPWSQEGRREGDEADKMWSERKRNAIQLGGEGPRRATTYLDGARQGFSYDRSIVRSLFMTEMS